MHPKRFARRPLLWGVLLITGLAAAATQGQQPIAAVQPPTPNPLIPPPEVLVDTKTGALIVPVGGRVLWAPQLPDKPIALVPSRPDVVDVQLDPNDPSRYLLTGRISGLAQITVQFKGLPNRVFDVLVQPDLSLLRTIIKRTVPTAAVEVQPLMGNMLVVSGYVATPQDADTVARLVVAAAGGNERNVINAIQIGGGQMVQIDVVIASVDRNMARTRGLDLSLQGKNVGFESIVSGLITSPLGQQSSGAGGAALVNISPAANLQWSVVPGNFFLAMQALRTEGIAKFLAEPKVVTQTGRSAFFRAGGQQATLSASSGITGPGVQYVPFGTELEVLPIVYGNGMIWLEINPRVTAISNALGITLDGALSPGFTEQTVRSAVMLESGQTYAIGGLIQNTVQASSSKVPFLGDLPFIGIGFSTVTHSQIESELVIMVTPRLVGAMNCDQAPKRVPGRETRNPDDYELFLENILEAPRGQRKVWNGCCYNAAYKCDPTAAIFPCVGGVCNGVRNGPVVPGTVAPPMGPGTPASPPPATGPASLPPVSASYPQVGSGSPVVPGSPVGEGSALPPVIVIPEVQRN
jgi:pilus assembly protein CpaC